VDVVEPWRACCDRPTRYERKHRRTGPIQNDLTIWQQNGWWANYNPSPYRETWLEEKLTWTLKRKSNTWWSFDWKFRRVVEKLEVGIEKNKFRRRWNIVEKSQSESKKFDAIDVGLYTRHVLRAKNIRKMRLWPPPRTPLGELQCSTDPLAGFRGPLRGRGVREENGRREENEWEERETPKGAQKRKTAVFL